MTTTGSDERDILTLALTGTRHSGPATPQTTPQIDQLALAEDESEGGAERDVLLRAGAWGAYRRAGYLPLPAPEPPVPAPADARPACSPAASEAVATLLRGRRFDLLSEALARLRAAGLRLPADTLPLALSSVGMTSELRAALIPALGERGRWLARFNPAWAWASEPSDEAMDDPARAQEAWDTGTLRQRVAALRGMRRRDPAAARDLLTAEWKREKAEARATLLAALSVNLSLEDEPLLTQALSDRSEQARSVATDLLMRLPASRLAQATCRLLESTLTLTGSSLNAKLPTALESADEAGEAGEAMRAMALAAFGGAEPELSALLARLQYIAPDHWEAHFHRAPDLLVKGTEFSRWRDEILSGWARATARAGSAPWAAAIWHGWLHRYIIGVDPPSLPLSELLTGLAPLLPPGTLQTRALIEMVVPSYKPSFSLGQTLACLPRPWNDDVAISFLKVLGKTLDESDASKPPPESWTGALPVAAAALPYRHFARAREVCAIADEQHRNLSRWKYALAEFTGSLYLRERVIKEIPL